MAKRPLMPMSRADRAKQFAPFSALKGLEAALEKKRAAATNKRTPSEDEARILNDRLKRVSPGDTIYIMYYTKKGYMKRHITVEDVDGASRRILSEGEYIFFDDIYAIKVL